MITHEYFVMNRQQDIIKKYNRKTLMSDRMMEKILVRMLEILHNGHSDTKTLYMLKREMVVSK
jgi:hypothetical protein